MTAGSEDSNASGSLEGEWTEVPRPSDFPAGTFASEDSKERYVLVMSRFAQRRQKTQRRPGAPPPRDAKEAECANCNQMGHTAQACNRPKLPIDQRKCHICDKTGHIAFKCPDKDKSKKSGRTNMVAEAPEVNDSYLGVHAMGNACWSMLPAQIDYRGHAYAPAEGHAEGASRGAPRKCI